MFSRDPGYIFASITLKFINMENQEQLNKITAPTPDIGDAFGHGWDILKKYFIELLLVSIISAIILTPLWVINVHTGHFTPAMVLLVIFAIGYTIFLRMPIEYGVKWVFLRAVRHERVEIKDMFKGFEYFLNVIAANILVGFIVGLGFIFLIIPGIIFACKLAFVPYLVMDKKLDPIAAFKISWHMTRGHALTIFLMGVISFFLIILGIILLVVGIIPAIIWVESAFASLYYAVDERYEIPEHLKPVE